MPEIWGWRRIRDRRISGLRRTDQNQICNKVEVGKHNNETSYRSYQIGDGQEVRFEDRVSEKREVTGDRTRGLERKR